MAKTTIEWTSRDGQPGHTWNPLKARTLEPIERVNKTTGEIKVIPAGKVGYHCEHISPGCIHCYAESMNGRCLPAWGSGLAYNVPNRAKVEVFLDEKVLLQPLKWKPGTTAFVCSMTDLFADFSSDEMIDRVFAVMALCPEVTFQCLTKRADRFPKWFAKPSGFSFTWREGYIQNAAYSINKDAHFALTKWPLPNVWLGVSVENQKYADERIPLLTQTPAAVRFVSYEPALEAVDFEYPKTTWPTGPQMCCSGAECGCRGMPVDPPLIYGIDWIIVGAESGPGARPFNEDWARTTRDQCLRSNTAFFYKQNALNGHKIPTPELDGQKWMQFPTPKVAA